MTEVLFQGMAEVVVLAHRLDVQIPPEVVIPPGYRMVTEVNTGGPVPRARFRVEASPGLKARYLRWRFPYRPTA